MKKTLLMLMCAVSISVSAQDTIKVTEKPFYISSGIGYSYGGIGLRGQFRFGDDGNDIAVHGGVGYDMYGSVSKSYAVGIKYFPFKTGWYVNGLIGKQDKEALYPDNYPYVHSKRISYPSAIIGFKELYHTSLLIGGDIVAGYGKIHTGFNVAVGGAYVFNSQYNNRVDFAFDLGFVVRF